VTATSPGVPFHAANIVNVLGHETEHLPDQRLGTADRFMSAGDKNYAVAGAGIRVGQVGHLNACMSDLHEGFDGLPADTNERAGQGIGQKELDGESIHRSG
jgi:hypothetical protein